MRIKPLHAGTLIVIKAFDWLLCKAVAFVSCDLGDWLV
jgi:hypothetical protein